MLPLLYALFCGLVASAGAADYENRTFTPVEFGNQTNRPADVLNTESKKLNNIVKGAIKTNSCYAIEKKTAFAWGYTNGMSAWNAVKNFSSSSSNYSDKIFNNAGWVRGTKSVDTNWGAFLWTMQNHLDFKSSETDKYSYGSGWVVITNVMVAGLSNYPAMSPQTVDWPDVGLAKSNYPGNNQGEEKTFNVDLTTYFQLAIPDILISPPEAVAAVGGSAVQFTAVGTNIEYGVAWSISPSGVSSGATIQAVGYSASVTPGTVLQVYKIRAAVSNCTDFYDEAELTVLKVDITDPEEDDVHLLGEELKFESLIEPSGLSGLTYAWSVLEGTCDPATASTEDFQTTLKSEGTIKVKLAVTKCSTTCEKIRTITTVLPEVTKISWKNDHNLLEGSAGTNSITDPVWIKTLGGAVTKNQPGAYTKDGTATAELEIEGSEPLTHSTSVQVKGDGNTENFYSQGASFHNWTWSSGELQLDSSPLYASVNFYDTLDVTWYYRVENLASGWGDWIEMNESEQKLYTTFTTPTSPEATPHVTILDYACHWATNQQSADAVCEAMLINGFSAHYTWVGNCNELSSDFIRLVATVGISGQQHRWKSKYFYPYGSPHIGAMVEQKTISFTPVGGSEGVIEWWWHQWAQTESEQRDPSAASSYTGSWGDYEDYLFTNYRECTGTNSTPYQTQWVTNQVGQASGCESYPANCDYLTGTLENWLSPDR